MPNDQLRAQLANAESDRLDALEEAENAVDDRDGYRRELARVRGQVRELEAQLRTERHEHAETRARLARAESGRTTVRVEGLPDGTRLTLQAGPYLVIQPCGAPPTASAPSSTSAPTTAYDLNPTAAQLAHFRSPR